MVTLEKNELNLINGGDFLDAVFFGAGSIAAVGVAAVTAPAAGIAAGAYFVGTVGVAGILGTLDAHSW